MREAQSGTVLHHYMQRQGLYVIPNVRWGDERTYTCEYLPEPLAFLGHRAPLHRVNRQLRRREDRRGEAPLQGGALGSMS